VLIVAMVTLSPEVDEFFSSTFFPLLSRLIVSFSEKHPADFRPKIWQLCRFAAIAL
jgi:hypothetical protein